MLKSVAIIGCLLGVSACSYTQRDVALVPAEPQIVTVPAPATSTTVYRSYQLRDDDDLWLPY